jgi:hypothetical protein
MDLGTLGSVMSPVPSYSTNAMTHLQTVGITSGNIYSFKFLARNAIGDSSFSDTVRFAAASPPSKPATPTKNIQSSTRSSIVIDWSTSAATEISI